MRSIVTIILATFTLSAISQNTVGLISFSEGSHEGYTLFSPMSSTQTYLIDNCGDVINKWTSSLQPGLIGYLGEDGRLYRAGRTQTTFTAGGTAGILEVYSWDGDLEWSHNFSNPDEQTHHDFALMSNGNVLMLFWESHDFEETLSKGKREDLIPDSGIWSEKIWEIRLLPDNQFEIVWEWNSWDHLMQDRDESLENYGIVAEHPEKFNINFPPLSSTSDWLHLNSIDYNKNLDQIVLSSRNLNEFYIIDHSTTTEEAKTGEGGRYGKGGDILHRWGNPIAYDQGSEEDQLLFGQHDAHWIDSGLEGENNVLVFNNGFGRPGIFLASTVEEIAVSELGNGLYELNENNTFNPMQSAWAYPDILTSDFYSSRISGSQRLENGNTLICLGFDGRLIEVNQDEEIVWEYRSPVALTGIVPQGANPPGNDIFKVQRYSYDYPAFEGKDLSSKGPIELDPVENFCMTTSTIDQRLDGQFKIYPNPTHSSINIQAPTESKFKVEIFNQVGQKLYLDTFQNTIEINQISANPGIFLIVLTDLDSGKSKSSTLIKL